MRALRTSVINADPAELGISTHSIATQDFPLILWQRQERLGLIKHRNCIRNQKSTWNSQVSLLVVTPFPCLDG